jgi:hypothetical protein
MQNSKSCRHTTYHSCPIDLLSLFYLRFSYFNFRAHYAPPTWTFAVQVNNFPQETQLFFRTQQVVVLRQQAQYNGPKIGFCTPHSLCIWTRPPQ